MDELTIPHAPANYSLSASPPQAEPAEETDLSNPLPRAVLRLNSHVLLDGTWRFAHDDTDSGLRDNWAQGHTYDHLAQWPGSVEEHLTQARDQPEGAACTTKSWCGTSAGSTGPC